jgi:hypothetical protein
MVGCAVGEQVTVGPGVVGKRVGWLVGSSEGGWDASRVGRIEGTMVGTGVLPVFSLSVASISLSVVATPKSFWTFGLETTLAPDIAFERTLTFRARIAL